jgi:hypothetical protein
VPRREAERSSLPHRAPSCPPGGTNGPRGVPLHADSRAALPQILLRWNHGRGRLRIPYGACGGVSGPLNSPLLYNSLARCCTPKMGRTTPIFISARGGT